MLIDPALGRVVPPGVLVHQHHADPAVQRLLDPPVALAALRPTQELDQLVARELHPGIGEIASPLGQLNQADQNLVVQRGRQPVLVGPHDRQPANNRRTVAPFKPILEDHRRLTVRNAIRQRGNRELGQVQLVLPAWIGWRRTFLVLPVKRTGFLDRHIPLVHPSIPQASRPRQNTSSSTVFPFRFKVEKKNNNKTAVGRVVVFYS